MATRAKPQTAQTPAPSVGKSPAGGPKLFWKQYDNKVNDHHWYLVGLQSCAAQVWLTDGGMWMGHIVPDRLSEQFATKRKAEIWCRAELRRILLADLKSLGLSCDELLRAGGFGEEITTELRRVASLLSVAGTPDCQAISKFLGDCADRIQSESGGQSQLGLPRETEDVP